MMQQLEEIEVITLYRSPADAARAYRDHAEALTCLVRAQDYSRLALAGCHLGEPGDGSAWQIHQLDAKRDLERCFDAARAACCVDDEGEREWRVWWAVRVEGMSLRTVPDASRSTAARIIARVDRLVRGALAERELLRHAVSDEEDERINTLDPRQVRTCMIVYGDEEVP
jgi:hypothetical protein